MSFRSKPVALGATDTDIYEVPVTLSAVVVLGIHNVVPSPVPSFTLKYYKQSTDTTTTLGTITFGSSPSVKYEVPFSMEPGDKLIGVASVASSVVVTPFITDNAAIPASVGFDPIGVWNSGTTYGRNDIVRVEGVASPYVPGKTYISIQDNNTNQNPATETAYWMVLVSDGSQGIAGSGDLSSSDIGVTVQGYDADTTKNDVANTFTAKQTFNDFIVLKRALENVNIIADNPASGDNNINILTSLIHYFTSNNDVDWNINLRGDGSWSLDSLMFTGQAITVAIIVTNGATPYKHSALKIDGNAVTPQWLGSAAPSAGTASKRDTYTFTVIKTGSATFIVQATFAGGN